MDAYTISAHPLAVTVKADGAEMCSLNHAQWGELLWQAGPVWPAHAPNLFPIVGQVVGDAVRVGGHSYPMARHGFARRRRFTWIDNSPQRCILELTDDDATREHYPFAFRLRIGYELIAGTLSVRYTIENPALAPLPASVGAHPAFRWPLVDGIPKTAHTLEFAQPEPAPIRRLHDGLLELKEYDSPIAGRTLALDESLFAADAIVMDRLASSGVTYSAPGAPAVEIGWNGFCNLGIWSKGGADFVCIEPWHGYASPVDFDGPFECKPGLVHVPPGGATTLTLTIGVRPPGPASTAG